MKYYLLRQIEKNIATWVIYKKSIKIYLKKRMCLIQWFFFSQVDRKAIQNGGCRENFTFRVFVNCHYPFHKAVALRYTAPATMTYFTPINNYLVPRGYVFVTSFY